MTQLGGPSTRRPSLPVRRKVHPSAPSFDPILHPHDPPTLVQLPLFRPCFAPFSLGGSRLDARCRGGTASGTTQLCVLALPRLTSAHSPSRRSAGLLRSRSSSTLERAQLRDSRRATFTRSTSAHSRRARLLLDPPCSAVRRLRCRRRFRDSLLAAPAVRADAARSHPRFRCDGRRAYISTCYAAREHRALDLEHSAGALSAPHLVTWACLALQSLLSQVLQLTSARRAHA